METATETTDDLGKEYSRIRRNGRGWVWVLVCWSMLASFSWILTLKMQDERVVITGIDPGGSIFSESERRSFGELDDPWLSAAYAQVDAETYRPMQYRTARVKTDAPEMRVKCGLLCLGSWALLVGLLFFRAWDTREKTRAKLSSFAKIARHIDLPAETEIGSKYLIYGRLATDGQPGVVSVCAEARRLALAAAMGAGLRPELCERLVEPPPDAPGAKVTSCYSAVNSGACADRKTGLNVRLIFWVSVLVIVLVLWGMFVCLGRELQKDF